MKKIFLYSFFLMILVVSCTEPYALQTTSFEDAVVIEATLTNEFKKQEVKLSRTYRLEENGPSFEEGAIVYVTDDLGNQYNFEENAEKYVSITEFQAIPNRRYQLHITTAEGKSYMSSNEQLTTVNEIQSVVPSVAIKEGVEGVEMTVNSFDPTNTSKYYRYEYEETYKIVAPKWKAIEAVAVFFPPYADPEGEMILRPRTTEAKICFSSEKSNEIILVNTSNLSEDRVHFPVRFIAKSQPIIAHRYSIFVKQYVQNLAAFTFYQTLKKLSGSESILSQNQPGFFTGNIKSTTNPNEKVIGFFDVSSYSEKRMFFNYNDLFTPEAFPKYFFECPNITDANKREYIYKYCFPPPFSPPNGCDGSEILKLIRDRRKVFYSEDLPPDIILYPIECGDCTSFSSNIKPLFWID